MFEQAKVRYFLVPTTLGLVAAIATCLVWAPAAYAQSRNENNDGQWSVGLGVVAIDEAYRSFDKKVYPLPVVSYENKWISASIPTLDVKLYSGESVSFRFRTRWVGDGYEAEDSPILTGMEDRKSSVWAGGAVIWTTDFARVSAEVLADAMSESKGARAKVQIDRRFAAGKFGFTPRLAAEWVDDKYVDYYYGVTLPEVRPNRPFYQGKATTTMQVGLGIDYTPASHHTVFFDLGVTRFGSAVEDSPLVDKPNQSTVALGHVYRF